MEELLQQPWPWYVAGPLIGLTVPLLLYFGNKSLSISSSLRHLCAAVLPARLPFFHYDWKSESWNLIFVLGLILGGMLAMYGLGMPDSVALNPKTVAYLQSLGLSTDTGLLPTEVFSWRGLFQAKGFYLMVLGGFLVGFGTRYAGGCTSGHSIFGLSTLQWPSLVATICFLLGGFVAAHYWCLFS